MIIKNQDIEFKNGLEKPQKKTTHPINKISVHQLLHMQQICFFLLDITVDRSPPCFINES